jgi:hypothetical protein
VEHLLRRSGTRYLQRLEGIPLVRALPPADLTPYAPSNVAFAARAWTLKAEEEYRSAAVFSEIVGGLIEAGAPLDVIGALGQVVRDEIAHASLCLDLSVRLGAPAPAADLRGAKSRLRAADRPRQALALLLFEGAIGETVSATLFHAGRRGTREPSARAALGAILRDEARHARLCWSAVEVLLADCSQDTREWLQLDVTRSFGAYEKSAALPSLRRLEAGETVDAELVALGVIPPELRVETFYGTIERVVLPRLARLGLDARSAWDDRYRK